MKKIFFIYLILMISCSDFQEREQILDYKEYLYQGWNAFETVNLDQLSQDSTNSYYYQLALDMFDVSALAIDYEFSSQNLVGPHYKSYNGIAWTQLYYANEFSTPDLHNIRDSLRQEAEIFFNKAIDNFNSQSSNLNLLYQDKCDTYCGLSYVYYYNNLNDLSLTNSSKLIDECENYNFQHDEIDFRNIHYLRGKIYLLQDDYNQACTEINQAIDCSCINSELDINVNILLDCFDEFSNGN